jgi:hypothetical protein
VPPPPLQTGTPEQWAESRRVFHEGDLMGKVKPGCNGRLLHVDEHEFIKKNIGKWEALTYDEAKAAVFPVENPFDPSRAGKSMALYIKKKMKRYYLGTREPNKGKLLLIEVRPRLRWSCQTRPRCTTTSGKYMRWVGVGVKICTQARHGTARHGAVRCQPVPRTRTVVGRVLYCVSVWCQYGQYLP